MHDCCGSGLYNAGWRPGRKSPRVAASIWYERMTGMVGRRGWRKSPTQTPEEFIELIDDSAVRDKVANLPVTTKVPASMRQSRMSSGCLVCTKKSPQPGAKFLEVPDYATADRV